MLIQCIQCHIEFQIKPGDINPDGNCCSRDCRSKYIITRQTHKKGHNNTCKQCNKEFYVAPVHSSQQFCSLACKGISSRLPNKTCEICGKSFKPRMGCSKQPCCSLECGYIYRRKHKETSCATCGKEFYSKGQAAKFCSKHCYNVWQGRNKTSHTCKICGNHFKWSPSRSKSYNITYCSLACRDADPERAVRLRQMNAKQLSLRPNNLERTAYAILDSIGVYYKPQYLINDKFCVDAFVPSLAIVIQFDGDYWHGKPDKFPMPDKRQSKRMKQDVSQDAYMVACGFKVIRIWETDIKKSPESVTNTLRLALT